MWIVIEATANYTLRGRTVSTGNQTIGCMLAATDAGGALVFAQFVVGYSAEQIQAGW